MEHDQAQTLFSDYVEGELAPDTRRILEEHLSACPRCRRDLDLLKTSLKLVRQLAPVEAPAEFSDRVRRRARKAGLFSTRRSRHLQRTMVPFESTLVVLLATVGALVFTLLLFHGRLQTLIVQREPTVLLAESVIEVNQMARAAWDAGGRVLMLGHEVPAGSPLGGFSELDLFIPPSSWDAFRESIGRIRGNHGLPEISPAPDSDGIVRVIVQIQYSKIKHTRDAADGASNQDRPQTHPGQISPPPGGRE